MMFQHNASFEAKIKFALASLVLCLCFFVGHIGCKKDNGVDQTKATSSEVQDRTENANPTATHGMLHFDSFDQLATFTKSLQDKEEDTTLVKNAYSALGINVHAETMPNLTDSPICLNTETTIGGYTSARKTEETVINAALNQGDENVNSVVSMPYWKTAINSDQAVHVGRRIYKYYDNGGIAVVLNNDWTLYEAIKSQSFESLTQSYNLLLTSDVRDGWGKYFTFHPDGRVNAEKQVFAPLFVATQAVDGKLAITNFSLVESTAGTSAFTWIYSDHSSSVGRVPNKTIGATEPLTVIVDNGSGKKDTVDVAESILACLPDNFTITNITSNQIKFELPGFTPSNSNYTIKWVFSNGTTATINPVTQTFTANGTATCQLFRKSDGSLACQFTKPYFLKCGDKKETGKEKTFTISQCSPDQKWKLDAKLWLKSGEVGCKHKYLKKVLGVFVPANNKGVCCDISGTYIRQTNGVCTKVTASGSKCLGEGIDPITVSFTIPEVSTIFTDPGKLSSGHTLTNCNGTIGFGVNGEPRLVLN